MKLTIEKLAGGVKVEVATRTDKKPLVVTLTFAEAEALVALLKTATKADNFKFTMEL